MSKLSLLEIAQSQLDTTPVVDGQLIVCLDTGNAYRDNSVAHVKIGNDLEVVSELPLAPLAEKLYYLKPDKLYLNLGGNQVLLNERSVIQDNLTSDSSTNSLSAKQGKVLKNLIDKKPDEMKLYPITIPAEGWKSDGSISYPYYIDIQISGIKESDCIAVTISPEDIDVAKAAYFTTTEAKNNVLRLRAKYTPQKEISAFYYFVREDVVKAFGLETLNVNPYTLPPATKSELGGVIVGDGLSITNAGRLSVSFTYKDIMLLAYPVGSAFFTIKDDNPAELFGGTQKKIAENRAIMGASGTHAAGSIMEAGLPDLNLDLLYRQDATSSGSYDSKYGHDGMTVSWSNTSGTDEYMQSISNSYTNAPLGLEIGNPIYGRSSTVQPPAYYMNIWLRTA